MKLPVVAAATVLAAANLHATDLLLDFSKFSTPYTSGWNPVYATQTTDTFASISNIDGLGYDFTFSHVATWDNGNATESLTRSGFYTFGNETLDHTFTLSGLAEGMTVSLYACAAWDGNGRGGYVVFGDSGATGVQAQTIGDPGTTPTLANLTLIGTATVDNTGTLNGTLNGAAGVGTASEGQVGGFVFVITEVPEPGTLALAGLGITAFAISRRKK